MLCTQVRAVLAQRMLNGTAEVCGPATFTAEFMLRSEWVDASAVAHQVIGCSIGGVICVWTLLILERIRRPSAFALAGGIGGFVMFFLQELLSSMGNAGALPAITAAWAAPALTALLAATYIASTEDG